MSAEAFAVLCSDTLAVSDDGSFDEVAEHVSHRDMDFLDPRLLSLWHCDQYVCNVAALPASVASQGDAWRAKRARLLESTDDVC